MMFSYCSNASATNSPCKDATKDTLLTEHINIVEYRNTVLADIVFSPNIEFIMQGNGSAKKVNKAEVLPFLNNTTGLKMNCKPTGTLVEGNAHLMRTKVEFNFDTFTGLDYVTWRKGVDSWQIHTINTTYK